MPLEPQVQIVVDALAAAPVLPDQTVEERRAGLALLASPGGAGAPQVPSVDRAVGGVPARVYTPDGATPGEAVLVWYHGGGWVMGDLDVAEPSCRRLAAGTGLSVVSVDYRLAPEDPFPAGLDDCLAALDAVAAGELGATPEAIVVGGDSAGGNLAAVVCQVIRDRGGPGPAGQLLVYPVTDATMATDSYKANGVGYLLTAEIMAWLYDQYVPESGRFDPKVSPLRASDFAGLPPAYVVTAGYDPLRDEGRAYADALRGGGVDVEEARFEGQIHGFFAIPEVFGPSAQQVVDDAAVWIAKVLSG